MKFKVKFVFYFKFKKHCNYSIILFNLVYVLFFFFFFFFWFCFFNSVFFFLTDFLMADVTKEFHFVVLFQSTSSLFCIVIKHSVRQIPYLQLHLLWRSFLSHHTENLYLAYCSFIECYMFVLVGTTKMVT